MVHHSGWNFIVFFIVQVRLTYTFSNSAQLNDSTVPKLRSSANNKMFNEKLHGVFNETKIVGGVLSKEKSWPWVVALVYVGNPGSPKQFCGGSIISDKYILSAGHCVYDILQESRVSFSDYRVYLGSTKINSSNIRAYEIQNIVLHPSFNQRTLGNDVSIIEVRQPISFNELAKPICLAGKKYQENASLRNLNDQVAVVVGWGATKEGGGTVNSQREVRVRIVPIKKCRESYGRVRIPVYPPLMICAASPRRDSCNGDSGGPLFRKRNKSSKAFDQIGIVSFGRQCAQNEFPGVYTKVSRFQEFIEDNTKGSRVCFH